MPRRSSRRATTPPPTTKERRFLPLTVKVGICMTGELSPVMRPGRLAALVTEAFRPGFDIDRYMVYKALRMKETLLSLPEYCLAVRKTVPSQHLLRVDAGAKAFVDRVNASINTVSAVQVCMEARRVSTTLGVTEENMPKFTKAWVARFKCQNGLAHQMLFGEARSVKRTAIETGRQRIQEITWLYHPDDIFNVDESAYFYRRKATRTIAPVGMALSDTKKDKTRVTMALGANCSGTEWLPLLVIGTAAMPVLFRANAHLAHWIGDAKRQPDDAVFHYAHTKKGRMTMAVFRTWLRELDARMAKAKRSILLLMDNVSSHRVGDIELTNVRLKFLPNNTSSVPQPVGQGVIKATKDFIYAMRDERDYGFYCQNTSTLFLLLISSQLVNGMLPALVK